MQNELTVLMFGDQPAQKGEMTISDMARTYAVSLRTLRFYEDKALLHRGAKALRGSIVRTTGFGSNLS